MTKSLIIQTIYVGLHFPKVLYILFSSKFVKLYFKPKDYEYENLLVKWLIALIIQCAGTQTTASKSVFDCIYDATDANQSIQLETNWNKLLNQNHLEEYIPGKIPFTSQWCPGNLTVRTWARGNMRKQVLLSLKPRF